MGFKCYQSMLKALELPTFWQKVIWKILVFSYRFCDRYFDWKTFPFEVEIASSKMIDQNNLSVRYLAAFLAV